MARRFINTAKFNPYTYEQLAAPIQRATAILAQQAQGLSALEMQNAALERYLDPELDKAEYDLYKQNELKLRNASQSLLKQGLNSNTYNVLHDASLTYARDIKPMQEAVVNRMKYNIGLADMLAKNPDLAIKGTRKHSLSEFYNGVPQVEFVSGNTIQKEVSDTLQRLAKARAEVIRGKDFDKYNMTVYQLTGYTAAEYEELMKDPNSFVNNIVHQTLQKHGVEDQNGISLLQPEDYNKMLQYANMGTYGLIGTVTANIADNGYRTDRAYNRSVYESDRKYALEIAKMQQDAQVQQIELAKQIAEETGRPLEDVLGELVRGENSNSQSKQPQFDPKGRPLNLLLHNKSITHVPMNLVPTIGYGAYAFQQSTVNRTAGLIADLYNNKISQSELQKGNTRYIKHLMDRSGVKHNIGSLTQTDITRLYEEAMSDYRKLQVTPFIAQYTVANNSTVDSYIKLLSSQIPELANAKQLTFRTNKEDPSKIDVYTTDLTTPVGTIDMSDRLDYTKGSDELITGLNKKLGSNIAQLIIDPKITDIAFRSEAENYTLISSQMLDLFITNLNAAISQEKAATGASNSK